MRRILTILPIIFLLASCEPVYAQSDHKSAKSPAKQLPPTAPADTGRGSDGLPPSDSSKAKAVKDTAKVEIWPEHFGAVELKPDSVQNFKGILTLVDKTGQKYFKLIVKPDDIGLFRSSDGEEVMILGKGNWTAEQIGIYQLLIEADRLDNTAKQLRKQARDVKDK